MTTQLTIGDRYRILPNAQRAGACGSRVARYVGQEVTLMSLPDVDGDVMVRVEGTASGYPVETFVLPRYLEPVTVVQPSAAKGTGLAFGQLCTLTEEGVSHTQMRTNLTVTTTTPFVLMEDTADIDLEVRVAFVAPDRQKRYTYARPEFLIPTNPELDAFKAKVRDAVIREAERRDWCEEADEWLEELGLESRRAPLPRGLYAVVELQVREPRLGVPRVAVRREDGWIEVRTNGANPLTERAVRRLAARDDDGKIRVLFEGK